MQNAHQNARCFLSRVPYPVRVRDYRILSQQSHNDENLRALE